MVQEGSQCDLLLIRHVSKRTRSEILWFTAIEIEGILMQQQAEIIKGLRNLHDGHRPVRGLKFRRNAFATRSRNPTVDHERSERRSHRSFAAEPRNPACREWLPGRSDIRTAM